MYLQFKGGMGESLDGMLHHILFISYRIAFLKPRSVLRPDISIIYLNSLRIPTRRCNRKTFLASATLEQ